MPDHPTLRVARKGDERYVLWPGDLAGPYKRSGYEIVEYVPATNKPESSGEERTEYRVAHNIRGSDETWELPLGDPTSRDEAEQRMATRKTTHGGRYGYRIESRTVTETDWSDVDA